MKKFEIPEKDQIPSNNLKVLDSLHKVLGFTPNIYSFMANSPTALNSFLAFNRMGTLFSKKEEEVINLTASQLRYCEYCLSAHTVTAKKVGFTDEEIIAIRKMQIDFDEKYAVLSDITHQLIKTDGYIPNETIEKFYNVGYTDAHFVEFLMIIGSISITNWLNNVTKIPIDFPLAPEI